MAVERDRLGTPCSLHVTYPTTAASWGGRLWRIATSRTG
jgi:hypothetical protein